MDNAMLKRGIGAAILAIIAALLLGLLLKDSSDERQDFKNLPLPGNPIPNLSTVDIDDTQIASLIEEKSKIEVPRQSLGDDALDKMKAITSNTEADTQSAENTIININTSSRSTNDQNTENKPGFAIRPPSQNQEQKTNTSEEVIPSIETNETVVAQNISNTNQTKRMAEEVFKPIIENEPEKKPTKTVIKNVVKKQPTKVVTSPKKTTSKPPKAKVAAPANPNDKYTIQLLATSSESRANKLGQTMRNEGYISFITEAITKKNKILYRVRVGVYESRSKAIKAQKGMKRRYTKNFSVQNSLVVTK